MITKLLTFTAMPNPNISDYHFWTKDYTFMYINTTLINSITLAEKELNETFEEEVYVLHLERSIVLNTNRNKYNEILIPRKTFLQLIEQCEVSK